MNSRFGIVIKGIRIPEKRENNLKEIIINSVTIATSRSGLHRVEYLLEDKDIICINNILLKNCDDKEIFINEIKKELFDITRKKLDVIIFDNDIEIPKIGKLDCNSMILLIQNYLDN